MPLSCFSRRGRHGRAVEPSPAPAPSSSSTSVYWTHLGAITLTWSRAPIGLLLAAELLAGDGGGGGGGAPARFELRPWLPWRRRGSKHFTLPGSGRAVAFSWDLSRARFAAAGRRPEPASRYSLLVSVDGEVALAVGDAPATSAGLLLSRQENAVVAADGGTGESYTTTVVDVDGEAHEVSLGVEDSAMWVAIDGEKALQVRRLRWKFRGSERLDLRRGRVRVTWDLHGWLFSPADAAAVFVLRFETSDDDADEDEDKDADGEEDHPVRQSSFRNHHAGDGGEGWWSSDSDRRGWKRGPFRSGSDTSPTMSVASTSATSSAGSVATVSEWAAAEEAAAALKDGGEFSLVVKLWKKRR